MRNVTLLSDAPSANVIPPETAVAFVAPAAVLPPVVFAEPSGWHSVFTLLPPDVPCPAFTPTTMPLRFSDALYITAHPEWIAE